MSLMDFFFPEQAEAMHLRSIASSMRRRNRTERRSVRKAGDIEEDVGVLALALLSLIGSLVEKGVISEEELRAHIRRVDEADGVADGQLTPDVLRGALGLARKPEEPKAPTPTRKRRR
jgi:hypothetical protein